MAGKGIVELTEQGFDADVGTGLCLVDFWAPWCGPCRMQTPILEALAPQVGGTAKIAKLNVDEAPQVAAKYGIRSIPTLILFKAGKPVKQFGGVQQAAALKAAIDEEAG